ncbi:crooked neck-like protein 1 [Tanacetum coccineum]
MLSGRSYKRILNVQDRYGMRAPKLDAVFNDRLLFGWMYVDFEDEGISAQQIHERWMVWNPDQQACRTEVNCKEHYVDRDETEDTIVSEKRFKYEEQVKNNPLDYDSWFDYIKLEESVGNKQMIQEVYERAIANVPPAEEKRYWQRYIYLWINYSLYDELCAQDISRTRDQSNLSGARAILGKAIGLAPKHKFSVLRCCERARAIFELAFAQPALEMPGVVVGRNILTLDRRRYEEYVDYIFPEELQASNLKILEQAYKWKKRKVASDDDDNIDH